jgi:outer membrane protein assembly factor BamB
MSMQRHYMRTPFFTQKAKVRYTLAVLLFLHLLCALAAAQSAYAASSKVDPAKDWPEWRGPTRDGHAAPGQTPPVEWNETNNIVWKAQIAGGGHGSPIVVGDRIYLATAARAKPNQSVVCFERATGKLVWQTEVHGGQPEAGKQSNSSAASSTLACDGERLFINFLNQGAVHTTALDLDGKVLWQQKVCEYVTHQGFGSSPVLYQSLVLVSADHRGGGVLTALDRATGKVVWRVDRPKIANYTTPAVVQANGRAQMVLAGCNLITSLDPATGKKFWEIDGSTEECVTTMASDGVRVFASGGYPRNHTVAVVADGSGRIAWQNNSRLYVPSPIVKDGYVFGVLDAGLAICWKADTGEELWKERLGGDFFSSPVMVGERIYASNVRGKTFVFEATPQNFKILAQNQLGDEAYATPAICDSRIYLRVAKRGDKREEFLYCVGIKTKAEAKAGQ